MIKRGGFPAVALESMDEPRRGLWSDAYIATYLERDLRDVANLQSFRVLMRAAAVRIGNLLNHAELGRDARMSLTTVHQAETRVTGLPTISWRCLGDG